jgi:tRNA threonylcarbamoyladenosine biosynthesis protein TsaE
MEKLPDCSDMCLTNRPRKEQNMEQSFHSSGPDQTKEIAALLALRLRPGDVVAMEGGLGAGKSEFVKGLAAALGSPDDVTSPTYTILHCYSGKYEIRHFDLYRMEGGEDLQSVGFFDALDGSGIVVIEWSERAKWALPENHLTVRIEKTDGDEWERIITIRGLSL